MVNKKGSFDFVVSAPVATILFFILLILAGIIFFVFDASEAQDITLKSYDFPEPILRDIMSKTLEDNQTLGELYRKEIKILSDNSQSLCKNEEDMGFYKCGNKIGDTNMIKASLETRKLITKLIGEKMYWKIFAIVDSNNIDPSLVLSGTATLFIDGSTSNRIGGKLSSSSVTLPANSLNTVITLNLVYTLDNQDLVPEMQKPIQSTQAQDATQQSNNNIQKSVVSSSESEIDALATASPEQIKNFIKDKFGEQYIEDVEYLTRILSIERGCSDSWQEERGAIAQVVMNRVNSKNYGNTVKDVVATNNGKSWFGAPNSAIMNANRGIEGSNDYRKCTISAIKFLAGVGKENQGAIEIGGRTNFVHRCTQERSGRNVPSWNYINPTQVQSDSCAAYFSGNDITQKDPSLRRYRA